MNKPTSKRSFAVPFATKPLKHRFPIYSGAICACLLLSSCASVSVKNVASSGKVRPSGKPSHIYVVPFAVNRTQSKENFAREKKGQLKYEARQLLATELVADLSKHIAPASISETGRVASPQAWVVSGEITRIAEGSRFLRMGFGLGMGGTKLNTKVEVRADSGPVFLRFATTGGSGAVPGAATNPAPFSSLPTALLHTKEGMTDDAQRTARMISAGIGDYMVKRGWLSPENLPKLKIQGEGR